MAENYKWREIADLPADAWLLTNNELVALWRIWLEQKDTLADQRVIEDFHQQLRREWAIETGNIEGVYVIDRGVTEMLIEHGINASLIPHQASNKTQEHVAAVIQDHADVLDGLFDFVKGDRNLTTGFIKELHQALLQHEDSVLVVDQFGKLFEKELRKGVYKTTPNNPRREDGSFHEYCPPEHVPSEMDRLVKWHAEHVQREIPVEVEAAWLHHRFTQIHPFEDGNGRVARAIASLIFIKAGWFPVIVRTSEKVKYIEALEVADSGDLRALVSQFSEVQKRLFLKGLDLAYRAKPPLTVDAAVDSVRDLLIGMGQIPPKEWVKAREIAAGLRNRAVGKLNHVAERLRAEIGSVRSGFTFQTAGGQGGRDKEILQVAEELHYPANPAESNLWALLQFVTTRKAQLVISFHGVGAAFRGILAASAFFQGEGQGPVRCCDEFFQINYAEEQAQAEKRFDPWLESSLVRGLSLWQETIRGEAR
ncbi:MAG: Fic family protein [Bryobacteraceae bacterium]|jgi:fido (protein-threonine AMPylation protein)